MLAWVLMPIVVHADTATDRTPPRTTLTATASEPAVGNWTRGSWSISLACEDPAGQTPPSGCASTTYRIDGSPFVYAGPFTLHDEGMHSVVYGSKDVAGNADERQIQYSIDRTTPETLFDLKPMSAVQGGHTRDGWRIVLSCRDPLAGSPIGASGCLGTEYQIDGGALAPYNGAFTIISEGEHVVRIRSFDTVGNVEAFDSFVVGVDRTGPRTWDSGVSSEPSSGMWTRGDWTVVLTCFDEGAGTPPTGIGCDTTRVGTNGLPMVEYTQPIQLLVEGRYTLAYTSLDLLGNRGPDGSAVYAIDQSSPVARMEPTILVPARPGTVVVRATATDAPLRDGSPGSGVTSGCFRLYRIDTETLLSPRACVPAEPVGEDLWSAEVDLAPGVYAVAFEATDLVGNARTSTPVLVTAFA